MLQIFSVFCTAIILGTGVYSRATELLAVPDITVRHVISEKVEKVSAGQIFKNDGDEPLWITANGRVPLLIFPMKTTSTQIKIDPPPVQAQAKLRCEPGAQSQAEVQVSDREASDAILGVFEIQKLIGLNRRNDARLLFQKLQAQHPRLSALDFLGASLDVVDGKREDAKSRLKKAIEANPNYEDGKHLLKTLQAGDPQ